MSAATNTMSYKVTSIEKTTPPDGAQGNNWYRYVIRSGNAVMEGKMAGTLKQVTTHADELAEQINTRNTWGQRKGR